MIQKLTERRKEEGFTLVELLVVIVILGILAAIVVFAVSSITDKGQTSACKADYKSIETAEEAYYANQTTSPAYVSIATLTPQYLHETSKYYGVSVLGTGTGYSITALTNSACANVTF